MVHKKSVYELTLHKCRNILQKTLSLYISYKICIFERTENLTRLTWLKGKKINIPQSFRSVLEGLQYSTLNNPMRLKCNISGNYCFLQMYNFYCHINGIHRDASNSL